jgi:hypothetical protein
MTNDIKIMKLSTRRRRASVCKALLVRDIMSTVSSHVTDVNVPVHSSCTLFCHLTLVKIDIIESLVHEPNYHSTKRTGVKGINP